MSSPRVQLQSRMGSTRLPGKALLDLGHARLVESVYRSCIEANNIADVVLITGDDPANEALVEWARRHDVSHFVGPESDLLERHRDAADSFGTDPMIRICGDSPFVLASEIDRVLSEHEDNNAVYTTNVAEGMPRDTSVDVVDRAVLDDLTERGETHPVIPLREQTDQWDVCVSPNPELARFQSIGTDIDTPAEYWNLVDAIDAVGPDPMAVREYLLEESEESET